MNRDLDHELFHELQRQVEQRTYSDIRRSVKTGYDDRFPGDIQPVYQALMDVGRAAGVRINRVEHAAWKGRQDDGFEPSGRQGAWSEVRPDGQFEDIFVVTGGAPLDTQARCLLHEEAHLFTPYLTAYDRHSAEIIAESVTYILMRQLGFHIGAYSPNYVADWSRREANDPVVHPERLQRLELPVLTVARRLGDAIDRQYNFRQAA